MITERMRSEREASRAGSRAAPWCTNAQQEAVADVHEVVVRTGWYVADAAVNIKTQRVQERVTNKVIIFRFHGILQLSYLPRLKHVINLARGTTLKFDAKKSAYANKPKQEPPKNIPEQNINLALIQRSWNAIA